MGTKPRTAAELKRARRLRRLREIFGPGQSEFCRQYGFSYSQWSNYEAGFPPSLAAARLLKRRFKGLTLDWIYDGDIGGLTLEWLRMLNIPQDDNQDLASEA